MALEIIWQDSALSRFENIISYINREFGFKAAKLHTSKVLSILDTLAAFPELGPVQVKSKNIRGFVLSKQITMFYRIEDHQLIIIDFFDTRLSPSRKNF
jgi:plasmid stabilization system protein ParE